MKFDRFEVMEFLSNATTGVSFGNKHHWHREFCIFFFSFFFFDFLILRIVG